MLATDTFIVNKLSGENQVDYQHHWYKIRIRFKVRDKI